MHIFLAYSLLLPLTAALIDQSTCKTAKGCFPDPNPVFTWVLLNSTHMDVEVQGPGDGTGYIAIGFSFFPHNGQDYIIECSKIGNGDLSMKYSWNTDGPANQRIAGETEIEGTYFHDVTTKVEDGMVYCSGRVYVAGWAKSDLVLNVTRSTVYYHKYAYGPTNDKGLIPHECYSTLASWDMIDFASFNGSVSPARASPAYWKQHLKRAHAILMVISWCCFIPTALLFARFLKGSWPEKKPMGIMIWFHVHRTANIFGIITMIAAFICIMCAMEWKWTGPGSAAKYAYRVHSMIGLLALNLAWIQPLLSLLRCPPSDPKRPIFNWAHRLIGFCAYILASASMGTAAFMFQSPSGVWGMRIQMEPGLKLALVLVPLCIIILLYLLMPFLDLSLSEKEKLIDEKNKSLNVIKQGIVIVTIIIFVVDTIVISVLIIPS